MSISLTSPGARLVSALALLTLAACAPRAVAPRAASVTASSARLAGVDSLVVAPPQAVGLAPTLAARLDSLMRAALAEGAAPGGALAVGRYGRLVLLRGYGATDWPAGAPRVDASTLYDLASLTKVLATTTAAMLLEEEGRLDLAQPVRAYLPEFDAPDKAAITVRMLLTHQGGLEAYAPLYRQHRGRAAYVAQINARPLRSVPGTRTVYSDWDMVLLQAVIERITGRTLDAFVAERVFRPLGMRDARYRPDTSDAALRRRIAPTAIDTSRGGLQWGVVHDGNAWAIGGVSGHAGLFASARDLAVFAQMLLNGGSYGGVRVLAPQTIARWTAPQGPGASRALGWDTPTPNSSAGRFLSPRSFGHTGFTGTSLWVDPERGVFVVLLLNRVHSRGMAATRHAELRREIADAVQQAIVDAPLVRWEASLRPMGASPP
ncbi:MAG: serine hydrolase domain-containing protein [Gemmatirosa sp.]